MNNLFVGVPCVLGKTGIEKIIVADLSDKEKEMLAKSCKVSYKPLNQCISK